MRVSRLLLLSVGLTGLLVGGSQLSARWGEHMPDRPLAPAREPAAPKLSRAASPAVPRAEAAAAGVLRTWDLARAAAWAAGDAQALRRLYAPGSRAGRVDVAMLAAWRARGLRVEGLSTQLLAVRVVRRTPHRWVLRVEDRVTRAVAVGSGQQRRLPADRAGTSVVELVSVGGAWRVASVRRAAPS